MRGSRRSYRCLLWLLSWTWCPASATAQSWSFFVIGDTRTQPEVLKINVESMYDLDPHAVACFNGGDLTANGRISQWNAHHQALADGAEDSSVPADPDGIVRQSHFRTDVDTWGEFIRYVGVLGNHDDGVTNWLENWNLYLPGQKNLGHNGRDGIYFSLTYRNALFIVLDSVHPSTAQSDWLAQVLQSTQAAQATWKFALFHHPVYPCNGKSPFDEGLDWVSRFEQAGIDIAFVGHSHTYERTCPMVGGDCAPGGVIYLNASGGAAPVRDVDPTKRDTVQFGSRSDTYDCADILEAGRGNWHHFGHVTVDDCRLTIRAYDHDYPSQGDSPWDTLVLDKCGEEEEGGDDGMDADGGDGGTDDGQDGGSEPDESSADVSGSCGCATGQSTLPTVLSGWWLVLVGIRTLRRKDGKSSSRRGTGGDELS